MSNTKQIIAHGTKHRVREGALVFVVCLALYLLLTLVTYHHSDPAWSTSGLTHAVHNAGGKIGAYLSDVLLYGIGFTAYLFPFLMAGFAYMVFRHRDEEFEQEHSTWWGIRLLGLVAFMISMSGLMDLYLTTVHSGVPLNAGGVVGTYVGQNLASEFSIVGASIVLIAVSLIGLTLLFGISWHAVIKATTFKIKQFFKYIWQKRQEKREKESLIVPPITAAKPKLKSERKAKPVIKENIAASRKIPKVVAGRISADLSQDKKGKLPALALLDQAEENIGNAYSAKELEDLSRAVEIKLAEFGIEVKVVAVYPGPVVTRFELKLAPGMKVSKISNLSKDLARSLSKTSVRVVEVIPGKAVIGLEIPNDAREMVRLREILEASVYQEAHSLLTLALGKDISGNPVVVDVARMPHLLVAGTTGSGKSVSINAMILSLLYKATPEQVRLIMIDPKMLELSVYEGIPHLLCPVVTDMKEAANSFRWSVVEMDRRYRLMAALSVRNLAGYNKKIRDAIKNKTPIPDPFFQATDENFEAPILEPLPQVVIVVDELADMMMVVGKKVEQLIARIAQKARASGIHLILATQRPSVDVLTGLIKSNIPTRISFQVSSKIDSRTILDQQGAEQLLGHGDMLYLAPGTGAPVRIHGAFVDDHEVHKVTSNWKRRGEPTYIDNITAGMSDSGEFSLPGEGSDATEDTDALYDQVVQFVTEGRRVSISSVQRRFKIGYNRAARLVEEMERTGVVSPMESNGSREVLAPPPAEIG